MTRQASTPLSLPASAGLLLGLLAVVVILALAGLVPSSAPAAAPPGFWGGCLHGALLFGALIASFLQDGVLLIAAEHQGWTYNLGFYVGASLWFVSVISLQGAVKAGFDRAEEKLLSGDA